jgi:hypothetical protein
LTVSDYDTTDESGPQPAPTPGEADWITALRERIDAGKLDLGGPTPPAPCRECGGDLDLTDEETYSPDRRRTCRPCMARAASRRRLERLERTVPPRYAWARLDAPEMPSRVRTGVPGTERVNAILRAERVVFLGGASTGKTSLAIALLREVAARGASAMFVSAFDLANARAGARLGEGDPPLVQRASEVGVLLIDEIGAERRTEMSDLLAVVWRRHDYQRPIWVTTGLDGRAIGAAYGGGFLRRIGEHAVRVDCGRGQKVSEK